MEERGRPPHLLITAVPYTMLAVLALFTTLVNADGTADRLLGFGLCAATAAWMLGMFTLRPNRDHPTVMTVYFLGLVALTFALVLWDPTFGFFTTAPYIHAYAVLPWPWRAPAVALVAIVASTAQASAVGETGALGIAIYLAVVAVNIVIMGGMAWFLHLDERERGELARTNRLLEATLAENADLHARLLVQARETGVLDERRRMAREIHDTVTQGLIGIVTQLQAAEGMREVPEEWRKPFDTVKGLARDSLSEARRSVHALRPEPLETARLGDALAEAAERCSAVHGIAVQVTTTGTVRPIVPEAEFVLLRTAQEALANVGRHAGASRAGVTLSYLDDEIALDVRDDGTGFDPGAAADGYGLTIMRQRVEGLSGTLRLETGPGAGTGISAHIPTGSR